ncbi:hypothetical protein OROMI_022105 [Orobanche minor]
MEPSSVELLTAGLDGYTDQAKGVEELFGKIWPPCLQHVTTESNILNNAFSFNPQSVELFVIGIINEDKYVIPDEAKKWVYTTLNDAWRGYKSRTKGKYYSSLKTEEEMIAEKPEEIPTEDFKILLKYWGMKKSMHWQMITRSVAVLSLIHTLTWVLKKLGDANPDLKLDIGEFCATVSSEDDNGTPMTHGGPTS